MKGCVVSCGPVRMYDSRGGHININIWEGMSGWLGRSFDKYNWLVCGRTVRRRYKSREINGMGRKEIQVPLIFE